MMDGTLCIQTKHLQSTNGNVWMKETSLFSSHFHPILNKKSAREPGMELTDDIGLLTHRMNEDLPKMEWIQRQYTRNVKLIDATSITHSNHYIARHLYSKQ